MGAFQELECFDVPRAVIEDFVERFAAEVSMLDEHRRALEGSSCTPGVIFKANFTNIHRFLRPKG